MLWVIDGTRLKRDYPRFLKGKESFRVTNKQGLFLVDSPSECFPAAWLGSPAPVIFDFKGIEKINYANDWRHPLYYLYPKSNVRGSVVVIVSRESFIKSIITGEFFKERQEPQKQIATPPIKSIPTIPQRQSQYIFERGQYVKRRRW